MPKDIQELVDLYAESGAHRGVDRNIIAAFIAADMEPPTRMQVDRGFTAAQTVIIGDFYRKYDPHGAKAEQEEIED